MKLVKSMATMVLLVIATLSFGGTFVLEDKDRYIPITSGIDTGSYEIAKKIDDLSSKSSKPITMLLNSPGGIVDSGTSILDAMNMAKARGVHFRCISGILAASMAFVILSNCNERFALANTKLLFHPMSSGGQGRTGEVSTKLAAYMALEKRLMKLQQEALHMDSEMFIANYTAETMWHAQELNNACNGRFLNIVENVIGVPDLFVQNNAPRLRLFGGGDGEDVDTQYTKKGDK